MSCAGCEDCSDIHWHLHVTVRRHSFSNDWTPWFAADCQRIGVKPIRVWNHFHKDRDHWPRKKGDTYQNQAYEEFIPTLNFLGGESEATAVLFQMGRMLEESGYSVERLKMEAGPNVASERRSLYAETHVKIKNIMGARARAHVLNVPMSTIGHMVDGEGHFIVTGRYQTIAMCNTFIDRMKKEFTHSVVGEPRVELCTLDTNPGKDRAWLAQ